MNIFAYTEPTGTQPAYVSLNERQDVSVLSVRGAASPVVAEVALSDHQLASLARSINAYLKAKDAYR